MANKAIDISTYTFAAGEHLLLDTNIWLYLFPAPSGSGAVPAVYSAAFKRMLAAGVTLISDALVVSEYLNQYSRIEWIALHRAKHPDFKKFRKSADFKTIGAGAAAYCRKIFQLCQRRDHPFTASDVVRVLAEFEVGTADWNDGLFVETCRLNTWKLVSHDSDMTSGGVVVLTANTKLLAACP